MPRWQPFDVVGGAYSDDTRPWTVQDTVNYLVVNAERPGGRSNKMLRGVPGLVTFSASMPESSVRGLYVAEGRLFAVVGTTLYRIATDGSATSLGTIPGVGRCVFTHNQVSGGNQVVIGNGQSGYVFDTTDDTLAQITDEGFPGFRSVDFADQYIIGVEPFGRYWFHSDLADATSYSTLDRAEAEKAPDRIMQAIATGGDILVLSERTLQFFYDTGAATGTWANRQGAEQEIGAASPWTACRLDNTVYWLGNDGSVYRLNGYVPQRISTHALEQAISRCTLSDAYAFTFEDNGHKCYLLTFPDGQTWCFDAATQEWTRRESYGFNRWRISALVKWRGKWIAGDFINGKLYQLDWRVQQEAGEPLERRRITGVLHDDQNRMIVNAVEFVFDTGMDEDSPPLPDLMTAPLSIAGNLPDGEIGDVVAYQYTASGGFLPYTGYAITIGTLPTGLALNAATGQLTGTLSAEGSFSWTVSVTDSSGQVAQVNDTATVTLNPATVDPCWDEVVLLTHFNDADGSTTPVDLKGKTWTLLGSAQVSDTNPKWGTGSLETDGSNGGGSYVDHADLAFGTSDFTIEWFAEVRSYASNRFNPMLNLEIGSGTTNAGGNSLKYLATDSAFLNGIYAFRRENSTSNFGATAVPTGSYKHFAFSRKGGTHRFFVDGQLRDSWADSTNYTSRQLFFAGTGAGIDNSSNMRVDAVRVTLCGRYESDFTPPTNYPEVGPPA